MDEIEGGIKYHFEITISSWEMGTWPPDRIQAFFAGLSQVLSARRARDLLTVLEAEREDVTHVIERLEGLIEEAKRRGLNLNEPVPTP